MSIGPTLRQAEIKTTIMTRIGHGIKSVVKEFSLNPLIYLFDGMITMTCIGLFFGMTFSYMYWFIMILLTINYIYKTYVRD